MEAFEERMRRGGGAALREMCRFFMKDDPVHSSLQRIAARLDELGVPYAIAGAMALGAHGLIRATVHVDILVTSEGLRTIHESREGLGYVRPFAGSKNLRDTESSVGIEFLITGQFPGDGKPKPVPFPDPDSVAQVIDGIRYLRLPSLVELKLASGMTNPGRLKDLGDVQELIKALKLPESFAEQLNPFVRDKYLELWKAVAESSDNP